MPATAPRIDLSSDTVTRPSAAMREVIATAEVGDDVFGDDPTVRALEQHCAALLGKEAAIFVPSGTMANQLAIRLHCRPGDELLCEEDCHIVMWEQGAHVQLSGVTPRTLAGDGGILTRQQFDGKLRPQNEHCVRTRLVCLENTHNNAAGRVQPLEEVAAICAWAKEQGLGRHLDGARLFNAVVASGISAKEWASHFDTVSVCFSKGLGAPVGSAVVGSAELLHHARRHRKVLGGGMRQSGLLAAAALYALEHNVERLAKDHANAQRLAEAVRQAPGLRLDPDRVDTNMLYIAVDPLLGTGQAFCDRLETYGVRMLALGPQRIRAVTHLDVSAEDVEEAGGIITAVATDLASSAAKAVSQA